jgi:protein SCO1/2
MKMNFRKFISIVFVILAAITGVVAFNIFNSRSVDLHGMLLDPPLPANDFTLTSADGPVSLDELRGKVVVLFFGYTYCPDVCPTTMVRLAHALDLLGKDADDVQVVMISVDPERDTPERLAEYVGAFDPSFMGLTGTPEEVAEVASAYGIYLARAEGSAATGYLVDHTSTVTVLDRNGERRLLWSFEVPAEGLESDLRVLLRR